MDRDRMADYQAMASDLRAAGIRAEVYLGNPKNFGNQLKYADKRQSPVAVIQGSDEAARGKVQLKDLILGAKLAAGRDARGMEIPARADEVDRADLVAGVKALLDRHR
jgi:histidyl-tRNA synthetase